MPGAVAFLSSFAGRHGNSVSLRLIAGAVSGAALSLSYTVLSHHLFLGLRCDSPLITVWRAASGGVWMWISSRASVRPDVAAMDCHGSHRHGGVSIVGGWGLLLLIGIAGEFSPALLHVSSACPASIELAA